MNSDMNTLSLIAPSNYNQIKSIYANTLNLTNLTEKEALAYEKFQEARQLQRNQKIAQLDHMFKTRNQIQIKKFTAEYNQQQENTNTTIQAQQKVNQTSYGLFKKVKLNFQHPRYINTDAENQKLQQIISQKEEIKTQEEHARKLKTERNLKEMQMVKQQHIDLRQHKQVLQQVQSKRDLAYTRNLKQTQQQDQQYLKNLKIRQEL